MKEIIIWQYTQGMCFAVYPREDALLFGRWFGAYCSWVRLGLSSKLRGSTTITDSERRKWDVKLIQTGMLRSLHKQLLLPFGSNFLCKTNITKKIKKNLDKDAFSMLHVITLSITLLRQKPTLNTHTHTDSACTQPQGGQSSWWQHISCGAVVKHVP